MLIDLLYFNGELMVPNLDKSQVSSNLTWYINKYEGIFLQKLLGYSLYKVFVAGIAVISPAVPDQRYLDILYGKEYTDAYGNLQMWKGLIVTDYPFYNLAGGYLYKRPEYLKVGTTAGLLPNSTTYTNALWIGWTPILTRSGSVMQPTVDYSYDITLGKVTLLIPGDKFNTDEKLFAAFELRTDSIPQSLNVVPSQSCIANYIYFMFRKANATLFTGIGEVITSADENSVSVNPRRKLIEIWNELSNTVDDFICFMNNNQAVYPEYTFFDQQATEDAFEFQNPVF